MTYLSPHFFIIGERKCGTSSLYRYLVAHPNVLPCQLKEPQFFSKEPAFIRANITDYLAMFPARKDQQDVSFVWPELNEAGVLYHEEVRTQRIPGQPYWTGEASANTFHEGHPELVREFLPEIRLVLMLREPVARAFSHHRMFVRFQEEGRDFAKGTRSFEEDMRAEMADDGQGGEFLAPGCYLRNLKKWEAVFPAEQVLVLFAEELDQQPQAVMDRLLDFLELPAHQYGEMLQKRFNHAPPAAIPAEIAAELRAYYAPWNEALAEHLGRNLPW
ncbi:MAG: sulfotransferase [Bacteroidota bacterium]